MKIATKQFENLLKKIRANLIRDVKANNPKASIWLSRMNKVCRINRSRNLTNGMPGTAWIDVTMDKLKADIAAKGL